MTDVARAAGVSHQTVSRVLNGQGAVRSSTRRRVLEAIEQLDYRPNTVARALASRRSQTLGIVTSDSTLFGPASTVHGIESAARAAGYFVSIASARSLDDASVLMAMQRLQEQAVDGIIVIAPQTTVLQTLPTLRQQVPMVAVSTQEGGDVPAVLVDNQRGAERATRYLLELGHEVVHHIAGPPGWSESDARIAGWRQALTAAGATHPSPLVGDWSARSGHELGAQLAADPSVTAVFVANDDMALGLLRALREAGRRAPEDVSIVGFDDTPQSAYFAPPLSTVRQDFAELGRRSMEILLAQIAGPRAVDTTYLEPELVLRDSAARFRQDARRSTGPDSSRPATSKGAR